MKHMSVAFESAPSRLFYSRRGKGRSSRSAMLLLVVAAAAAPRRRTATNLRCICGPSSAAAVTARTSTRIAMKLLIKFMVRSWSLLLCDLSSVSTAKSVLFNRSTVNRKSRQKRGICRNATQSLSDNYKSFLYVQGRRSGI